MIKNKYRICSMVKRTTSELLNFPAFCEDAAPDIRLNTSVLWCERVEEVRIETKAGNEACHAAAAVRSPPYTAWDLRRATSSNLSGELMTIMNRQSLEGFSLIELLIVVAIILIISAIAIPNLLHARISANEASAVGSVRAINIGMVTYYNAYPTIGYAANLKSLGGTAPCTPKTNKACLIDDVLATGTKSGYTFTAKGTAGPPNPEYYASAIPMTLHITGSRSFCSIEDAVVRVQPTGAKVGNRNKCLPLIALN